MIKNSKKSLLKNENGQFVVEAVLLMVLSVGLLILGIRVLREGKILESLVASPWQKVAGMIESGNWEVAEAAAKKHPNQIDRSLSLKP